MRLIIVATLIVVGLPVAAWVSHSLGFLAFGGISLGLLFAYAAVTGYVKASAKQSRLQRLSDLYGPENARNIVEGSVWQGMTREMLVEALGPPIQQDETVMKKFTRRVYKYRRTGKNRFGLRVTLDDDVVIGWEDKR